MSNLIEPGIYIRPAALDNLPKTVEDAEFVESVRRFMATKGTR